MRLRPGTLVMSTYRARWWGTVLDELPKHAPEPGGCLKHVPDHCVVVLRTHDRHGRPMRKPSRFTIDPGWLEVVPSLPRWPWWTTV